MPTQEELVAFHVEAPTHPEVRKIAQDVLQRLKYSFLTAAAQQDQAAVYMAGGSEGDVLRPGPADAPSH